MLITHNENENPISNLPITWISARSAPQIKDECTFHFSNFLLIGQCNYSSNCWFGIISLLTVPPEYFLLKHF